MDRQNIQPFILKSGNSANDQPNDNFPNSKMKYLYNELKSVRMLKYGTTQILPYHMNSIFVESWYAFKVSAGNIISDSFVKTKISPLIPPNLTMNIQACASSVQVSSGYNSEEINEISHITVATIEVK